MPAGYPVNELHVQGTAPANPPWGMGEAAVIFVCFELLQVCIAALLLAAAPQWSELAVVLTTGLLAGLCILALIAFMLRRIGGHDGVWAAAGFRRPRAHALLCAWKPVAAGIAAYLCVTLALVVAESCFDRQPTLQHLSVMIAEASSMGLLVFAWVMTLVVVPLTEEVLFRGILYSPLRARIGVLPAAVLVSLLFSVIHQYAWGAGQLAVLSLVLVAIFEATRSLWPCVVVHSLFNLIGMVVLRVTVG